jgi:hypothetical protein
MHDSVAVDGEINEAMFVHLLAAKSGLRQLLKKQLLSSVWHCHFFARCLCCSLACVHSFVHW